MLMTIDLAFDFGGFILVAFIDRSNALPILEKNVDKINWYLLSYNINANTISEQFLQ